MSEPTKQETFGERMARIRAEYDALPDVEWFKRVYEGKSLGEVIPVEPQEPASPVDLEALDGLVQHNELLCRIIEGLRAEIAALRTLTTKEPTE